MKKSLSTIPRFWAFAFSALLSGGSQSSDAPLEVCSGAALWDTTHPSLPQTTGKDENLRNELKSRVEKDQAARKGWLANQADESLAQAVDTIDTENLAWLRQLVSEQGFPNADAVGTEGVHYAWLLLQHADQDPAFQSSLLPVLEKRFADHELPANDLARLADRILVASGKPQKYGTQFDWFSGNFELPPALEVTKIDAERRRLGLMPLNDYVCTIRRARAKVN